MGEGKGEQQKQPGCDAEEKIAVRCSQKKDCRGATSEVGKGESCKQERLINQETRHGLDAWAQRRVWSKKR
jgi:hypothetical protein